jgi:hypothetical protein
MSVIKLLSRIVTPDLQSSSSNINNVSNSSGNGGKSLSTELVDVSNMKNCWEITSILHQFSFGITSDPLTQFACVFSAIIHDVDHYGVPNTQLMKIDPQLVEQYHNKSVAEQNSINIAWSLLMKDDFTELRHCIAPTVEEQQRFRQLVVNSVMATDIMDADLKALRNARWEKAFPGIGANGTTTGSGMFQVAATAAESAQKRMNRKATIVIEHLIQASDIAHTMQHWHVYQKWNERLFREMYQAYVDGYSDNDPTTFWYQGEIGFYDHYVIPLAKKLADCGVFGVSSSEYLDYAMKNRQEWVLRGETVVAEMFERIQRHSAAAPRPALHRDTPMRALMKG